MRISMDLVLKLSALGSYEDYVMATGLTNTAEDILMSNFMIQNGMPENEWNDTLICQ